MYEVICPACRRMVETPSHVAVVGARFKCPKCWTVLEVEVDQPLRVIVSAHSQGSIVRTSPSARTYDRSEFDN